MENNSNQITENLKNWLATQGYPLEMEVAKSFDSSKWNVSQSEYYIDPETKINREIDLIVSQTYLIKNTDIFIKVTYAIECKSTKNKPWILFSAKDKYPYDPVVAPDLYLGTEMASDLLLHMAIEEVLPHLTPCYHLSERLGYGLTQSFVSGSDVAYKAITSSAKCAVSLINHTESQKYGRHCEIVFPLIVIDERLFEAFLNDKHEMNINEIKYGNLIWKSKISIRDKIPVTIITREYLDEFVSNASKSVDWLFKYCAKNIKKIINEMDKTRKQI